MSDKSASRSLSLELVRATEAAAIAAARQLGRGDEELVDGEAVDAMRPVLGALPLQGLVVIGEGEKDDGPMFYSGEYVGSDHGPKVDVAIDPVDGSSLTATGRSNALSLIAVSDRGTMFDPGHCLYMNKLVVAGDLADHVDLDSPVAETLRTVARIRHVPVDQLTVAVLDRPRHADLIADIRTAGARIRLLLDGDTAGAINAARPESGVDLLLGVGGAAEGVLAACAVKCLGGGFFARLAPRTPLEQEHAQDVLSDPTAVLGVYDIVSSGDVHVAATGISDGDLLGGVRFTRGWVHTESLAMRAWSGTVRTISTRHRIGAHHGVRAAPLDRDDS